MKGGWGWGLLCGLLVAIPGDAAPISTATTRPQIEGLAGRLVGDRVVVSYRVVGGLSEEAEEWIDSGLPVTFRHRIEIVVKRGFPMLIDKVRARLVIETTAHFDALTRRYQLVRHTEVKGRQKKLAPPVAETRSTESREEMRAWMTELEEIEILEPARETDGDNLQVRVESSVGRRYVLLIFPARVTAGAEVPLTR